MNNVSGYGFQVNCIASFTFPTGFSITEFADDSDPFDLPSLQIADTAMGLNGDMIAWSKANPIKVAINVIPGSESDKNLNILLQANRVGRGKTGARDIIIMTCMYPDDTFITLTNGIITDGIPGKPVSSAGRLKTRTYNFAFEAIISA